MKDSIEFNRTYKCDYITGTCIFGSKRLFIEMNGFDSRFRMYAEDVDFCIRAKKKNYDCIYVHDALVWHHISSSIGGKNSFQKC